ncbi:MAG: ATPase, T2SS/T4P/T4SS family [Betaproteobacteria bacterium]|nr:ATPase, T2SS/T4P/T4SS family [Betaproteobacteria bacterium]MDH5351844.1 ATPase, T2SS/T4P/T4SS family [Betaproteobacteria bacterium]
MAQPAAKTAAEHRLTLAEIVDWLVEDGAVARAAAETVKKERRYWRGAQHPLALVAEEGWKDLRAPHKPLTLDALAEWLAKRVGLEYLHIDPLKINFSVVTEVMSSAYASRFRILPVELTAKEVVVATAEPFVREWEPEIARLARREVRRVIGNPQAIERCQVEFYNLAKSIKGANRSATGGSGLSNLEQLVELGSADKALDANDAHVVKVVDWLWQYAFEQRASDIHIEPRREAGLVRFRIDGVLHQVYQIPPSVLAAMTSRIKILGRMDVVEKRRPQDGRIKTRTADGDEVELRLSTLPTAFGEKLVMRIFDPEVLVRDFRELGFSDEDHRRWKEMTARPNGIVLVTGPTGSGKTTTLYSTLKSLATPEVNVCTIEDPIEMVEPAFNQMQVQSNIDLGFAEGVRALMRQDPDIIMVGEIRDLETAEMAVQAALTGHLVLSTLHTNDAPSAMTRLLELGVAPYLLNATFNGVMGQRLLRTLCPHCKQPTELNRAEDAAAWDALVAPFTAKRPASVYKPVGCLECRMTGFMGRVGIYETLVHSPGIKQLIAEAADLARVREQAMKEGMKPLRISGAMKVAAGLTTIDEVLKVAPPVREPAG